jgi:hypothetical protein
MVSSRQAIIAPRSAVAPQRGSADFPDFANMAWRRPQSGPAPEAAGRSATPEGIELKSSYSRDDIDGLDFVDSWPGFPPYLRGPYPTMYVERSLTQLSRQRCA